MAVTLVRIDDRLLHGQTVTRWLGTRPCKGVLIVDDAASKDEFQKKIFLGAAPAGVKVGVYDEEEGGERVKKAMQADNGYFVICKSPKTLYNLANNGVDFGKVVNVGPMSMREGTVTVSRNCSITEEEYTYFGKLADMGYDVQFQLIPDNSITSWSSIKDKYEKEKK